MKAMISGVAVLAAVSAAADLPTFSSFSDFDFAERYAFSTNRPGLIAELKRDTGQWYFYSMLNYQVEGEADKAKEFLRNNTRADRLREEAWHRLQLRQMFLDWEASQGKPRQGGRTPDEFLSWDLRSFLHINSPDYVREAAAAPDTYPSSLNQDEISFGAYLNAGFAVENCFKDEFRFLPLTGKVKTPTHNDYFSRWLAYLPGTPGLFNKISEYIGSREGQVFSDDEVFHSLTLAELDALAKKYGGADWKAPLLNNATFIDAYTKRLAPGADEDPTDYACRRAWLDRTLAFFRRLPDSQASRKVNAIRDILTLERNRGNFSERALLAEFAKLTIADGKPRPLAGRADDELLADYLAAFRRGGDDLVEFKDIVKAETLARIRAETDLLAGVSAGEMESRAISEGDFKALHDRVELKWSDANPAVFASDAPVTLGIDVKNVKKMRLAVYDVDAYSAAVRLGKEVAGDVDLDGCVPSVERTLDFSSFAPIVRHRERLELPELSSPGVYVVECSGSGVSSRALVRKGSLRIVERVASCGHVFVALDENGTVLKPAKVRIGETTYSSDERGEVVVPFATASGAGPTKAVVGAGGRAAVKEFVHRAEKYALSLKAFMPAESAVAGETAKAILSVRLSAAGEAASLSLVENPVLEVRLNGQDGDVSVRRVENFAISDDAESEISFVVPKGLKYVSFCLSGTVQSASEGKPISVRGVDSIGFNGVASTSRIEQVFLRRGADGYSLEVLGRNGEPISGREVSLALWHIAFTKAKEFRFQTDTSGRIRLGKLADIEAIEVTAPLRTRWNLTGESVASLPSELSASEGTAFEIAVSGLTDGEWPLADDLSARVSLYGVNREGAVTATFPDSLAYSNGVLRIAGLAAGDYRLCLRAEKKTVSIKVAKSAVHVNGTIAGDRRAICDTGAPGRIRIAEATLDGQKLRARLENASRDARVHVVCSRFVHNGDGLFDVLSGRLLRRAANEIAWQQTRTEYISGRDLGDTLRYILDRRGLPHRPGNMLERPSLLLTPWSVGETRTTEPPVREGNSFGDVRNKSSMHTLSAEDAARKTRKDAMRMAPPLDESPFYGFLATPAGAWYNLRPNGDGIVELDVPDGTCIQDVAVIAVDFEGADCRHIMLPTAELARHDIRHRSATSSKGVATLVREGKVVRDLSGLPAEDGRSKVCRSVGDAFGLVRLFASSEDFASFEFLSQWNSLSADERGKLYGAYASHELDLFLYFKDRRFFDEVVAPHLKNKRFKQFMDKWLLGEDISAWTEPGKLQDLDAMERCLLAKRVPSVRRLVADTLASECAAHPTDPSFGDIRLALALNIITSRDVLGIGRDEKTSAAVEDLEMPAAEMPAAPTGGSVEAQSEDFDALSSQLRQLRADAVRRRAVRQPYRPVDKTREWIETHHYRVRHADAERVKVDANEFWRDYAAAIADGIDVDFLSEKVAVIGTGLTECLGAISVLALPFDADSAKSAIVFSERKVELADSGSREFGIVQRFAEPSASGDDSDGSAKYVTDEFVAGRPYRLVTVFSNPTDGEVHFTSLVQVPDGAVALGGGKEASLRSEILDGYSMSETSVLFYFPTADASCGRMAPAVAMSDRSVVGMADAFTCKVVAKPSAEDTSSWWWISQNGTDDEVIAFLGKANLWSEEIDLGKIGWRMKNDAFARRVFDALDARGCFHEGLWLTTLEGRWRISDFKDRVRQLLSRNSMKKRLATHLGPSFHCALVDIDPEDVDLFEYAEFWPLVNARAHSTGSGKAVIPNETLKARYRDFLDYLATKRALSAKDRLDAAIYLVAQERVDEAERMVESVKPEDVDTKMQLDYLRAYFAFSRQKPEEGRAIALKYANWPVPRWRDRFHTIVAQADEIAGRTQSAAPASRKEVESAPSIELATEAKAGVAGEVVVRSRNVKSATLRAYPTDVEVTFSKNPFGGKGALAASAFLRPVWTAEVVPGADGTAKVSIPDSLRGTNILLEASDIDGRVNASLAVMSGLLDVQVASEYGELRVRDLKGQAIPAAYVKVYARDASGSTVKFHKDGYTDLRGAFNYADVSSDSGFKPAEFAILVLPDAGGVKTLTVKATN